MSEPKKHNLTTPVSKFPELTKEENVEIDRARASGFAKYYPAYPSAEAQARATLRGARAHSKARGLPEEPAKAPCGEYKEAGFGADRDADGYMPCANCGFAKTEHREPAKAPEVSARVHELKTDAAVFDSVGVGIKSFEIRRDDRGYAVGDTLRLRKTRYTGEEMKAGAPLIYEGEPLDVPVTYILRGPVYGLQEGWCIMAITNAAAKDAEIARLKERRHATCGVCDWTNVGCLNLATVGDEALWMCHGCIARERKTLAAELERTKEVLAKTFYDIMRANDPEGITRPWVEGGNSLKQDEARQIAREALQPQPEGTV